MTCTSNYLTFEEFSDKISKIHIAHHNLIYGIPFKNNSVQNIFSSHFLEHLTEKQAIGLLKECERVLKSGGIIRIVVPSLDNEISEMEQIINRYKNENNVDAVQKYLTMDKENHNSFSFHRKMYNFNELKKVLESAGFSKIRKKRRWQGAIENVSALDVKGGLIVEAYKV